MMRSKSYAVGVLMALAAVAMAAGYASSASAQKAEGKARRPRLPNYYASVVTDGQRAEINAIQEEYGPQIGKLRDELEAVTAKRDAAIEKVLSAEQRKQVAKLRAEAAARRQAANSAAQPAVEENTKSKGKAKKAA